MKVTRCKFCSDLSSADAQTGPQPRKCAFFKGQFLGCIASGDLNSSLLQVIVEGVGSI